MTGVTSLYATGFAPRAQQTRTDFVLKRTFAALLTGLALNNAPALAQDQNSTLKATHGAWEVRCSTQNAEACGLLQVGKNAEGQPVLQVTVRKTPGLKGPENVAIDAFIEIVAPIGVLLPAGVGIKIDGRDIGRGIFQVCNPQACLVSEPVQNDFIEQMKKGSNAVMRIMNASGSATDITISLSGFTKAYNSL